MQQKRHVDWCDLPVSVWHQIVQLAGIQDSGINLTRTCRRLRDVVLSVASVTKVVLNSQSVLSHKTLALLRPCNSIHLKLLREAKEDVHVSEKLRWGFQTMLLGFTLDCRGPLSALTLLHLKVRLFHLSVYEYYHGAKP